MKVHKIVQVLKQLGFSEIESPSFSDKFEWYANEKLSLVVRLTCYSSLDLCECQTDEEPFMQATDIEIFTYDSTIFGKQKLNSNINAEAIRAEAESFFNQSGIERHPNLAKFINEIFGDKTGKA